MPKSSAKSKLAAFGNGLLKAAVITAEIPYMSRMSEIETEIDNLQEEYARLNEKLTADHQRPIPYAK